MGYLIIAVLGTSILLQISKSAPLFEPQRPEVKFMTQASCQNLMLMRRFIMCNITLVLLVSLSNA